MARRYKAYPAYKKNNIETVKELPEKWVMKSLGLLALNDSNSFVDGPFGSDLKSTEYEDFGIPLIQLNNIKVGSHALQNMKYISESKKNELLRHVAKPNDIVIAKMAEPVARAALVNGLYDEYVIVADCVRLSVNQVICNLNYVVYAINSKEINSLAELASSGTTRIRINLSELKKLKIPFPSFSEQQTIAQFLDYETAKIDALIAKQEQLIELLKEKRQAVISHAVTKGLNPDAPMKDSGVEWLGQVPEHWQIAPLKYLCSFTGGGTPSKDNLSFWTDGNIPWVSPKDMKTSRIYKTQDYITETALIESSTQLIKQGALLIVVRSGILQRNIPIAINEVPVTLNQDMKALRFNNKINVNYVENLIIGHVPELLLEWSKEGATVESIEHEYLANTSFPVPPLDEQIQINLELEKFSNIYQTLETKAVTAIELLQERKTALISAAVTGKIDVRDWQPPSVG